MRERYAWDTARAALAPFGQLIRIESPLTPGFPDVVYCLRRVPGLLETKAGTDPSLDQVLFAEAWARAGGRWHLLVRRGRRWWLYDPGGARALYERVVPVPVVVTAPGAAFPLRAMLKALAPVPTGGPRR